MLCRASSRVVLPENVVDLLGDMIFLGMFSVPREVSGRGADPGAGRLASCAKHWRCFSKHAGMWFKCLKKEGWAAQACTSGVMHDV